jgi:hypothetical protein
MIICQHSSMLVTQYRYRTSISSHVVKENQENSDCFTWLVWRQWATRPYQHCFPLHFLPHPTNITVRKISKTVFLLAKFSVREIHKWMVLIWSSSSTEYGTRCTVNLEWFFSGSSFDINFGSGSRFGSGFGYGMPLEGIIVIQFNLYLSSRKSLSILNEKNIVI